MVRFALLIALLPAFLSASCDIEVWYGDHQRFGSPGLAQRWINILGRVTPPAGVATLHYSLNGGALQKLSLGPDGRRLARPGDFNIEIDARILPPGDHRVEITAHDERQSPLCAKPVRVTYRAPPKWPLPYAIEWNKVKSIQDAAQIVDGLWRLTGNGVRTVAPYYDRVLAFGDDSWTNYEVETTVTFHGFTPPRPGPPTFNVSHAAIAARWPGHSDDGNQPRVQWYPLGATAEFRLSDNLDRCTWRVFTHNTRQTIDSRPRTIQLDTKYGMKLRVRTPSGELSAYEAKLWPPAEPEPAAWDVLAAAPLAEDVPSGGALLVAHNTDVTFGDVHVRPLSNR
jgi:hypothetical protein